MIGSAEVQIQVLKRRQQAEYASEIVRGKAERA
jgi:hypothetical protein